MKQMYNQESRENAINMYLCGESIMSIHNSTGISRTTLYDWINDYNSSQKKPINMADYNKLKMHCEKLERMVAILKSAGCTVDAPLKTRYEVIKNMSDTYNVSSLCAALDVAKGSYYNHILRNKNENTIYEQRKAELTPVIEEIYNIDNMK